MKFGQPKDKIVGQDAVRIDGGIESKRFAQWIIDEKSQRRMIFLMPGFNQLWSLARPRPCQTTIGAELKSTFIEKSDRNPIFTRFFLNGARQIVANV